jgi:hypothetical protein
MVKNHDNLDEIGHDLSVMYYSVAGFTTVLLVLIILCEYNRLPSVMIRHMICKIEDTSEK